MKAFTTMISNNAQIDYDIQVMIDWYIWAQIRKRIFLRNHSPHHYTTFTSLNCKHKAGWVRGFILLVPNFDPTIGSSRVPQHILRFIRPGYKVLHAYCGHFEIPSAHHKCAEFDHFHLSQLTQSFVHQSPRRSAVIEILKPPLLASTIIPLSKSRSHFYSTF